MTINKKVLAIFLSLFIIGPLFAANPTPVRPICSSTRDSFPNSEMKKESDGRWSKVYNNGEAPLTGMTIKTTSSNSDEANKFAEEARSTISVTGLAEKNGNTWECSSTLGNYTNLPQNIESVKVYGPIKP